MKLDLNKQFKHALKVMNESTDHLFVTGKAGTGKSTLLQHWRLHTKKKVAVLAPTGVAALNVQGQTIHSFFGFGPDITLQKVRRLDDGEPNAKLFKKLEAIVIDEISMVRADLLDCIDKFLRLNGPTKHAAFGGIQMIFLGDLYQLPPVVKYDQREMFRTRYTSPFFFSAHVFGGAPESPQQQLLEQEPATFEVIELEKIYRQKDSDFIRVLNAIRTNGATREDFHLLNQRHQADFVPDVGDFWIHLTTTNARASQINAYYLDRIHSEARLYRGSFSGEVPPDYLPTSPDLEVKAGAQVMMVVNDRSNRWVNGTIGQVVGFEQDDDSGMEIVLVMLPNGDLVDVMPHTWEVHKWEYDPANERVETQTVGSFTQYPFRLAWAVTIHKSQGKTFDRVVLDLDRGTFASGQLYVALSRCRTLEGLVLKQQVRPGHVRLDREVQKFFTKLQ